VGLLLPLPHRKTSPAKFLTSGVLSGPKGFLSLLLALFSGKLELQSGYRVDAMSAIATLEATSPEAATWWRQNVPRLARRGRFFVFAEGVGRVIESQEPA
jgi:hypothetical protein